MKSWTSKTWWWLTEKQDKWEDTGERSKSRCLKDINKYSFPNRIVDAWDEFKEEVFTAIIIHKFKKMLDIWRQDSMSPAHFIFPQHMGPSLSLSSRLFAKATEMISGVFIGVSAVYNDKIWSIFLPDSRIEWNNSCQLKWSLLRLWKWSIVLRTTHVFWRVSRQVVAAAERQWRVSEVEKGKSRVRVLPCFLLLPGQIYQLT